MRRFIKKCLILILVYFYSISLCNSQISQIKAQLKAQVTSQLVSHQDTFQIEFTLNNSTSQDLSLSMNVGKAQFQRYEIKPENKEVIILNTGQYMPRNLLGEIPDYHDVNFLIRPHQNVTIKLSAWNQTKDDFYISPQISLQSEKVVTLIKWFRITPLGVVTSIIFLGGVLMFMIYFLAISLANPVNYRWYYILHLFFVFTFYLIYLDHVFQINFLFPDNSLFVAKIIELIRIPVLLFYIIFYVKILGLKAITWKMNGSFLIVMMLIHTFFIWYMNHLTFALNKLFIVYPIFFMLSIISNYRLYKVWRGQIKKYIIPGSIIFGICVLPEVFQILLSNYHYDISGYYLSSINLFSFNITQFGILSSLIFFSMAIGYKQRELLLDRNVVQQKFISELEKNNILQEKLTHNLKSEIKVASDRLNKKDAEMIKSEYENKILQLESELLSSQMSPHFIFNSLNSVKYYALTKSPMETANFVTSFAKLMRIILKNSRKRTITIQEEVEFLEIYLDVEQRRFNKKFEYDIVISKDIDRHSIRIPPMLLQSYIENSLWHGLLHKDVSGQIIINFKRQNKDLICIIEDNGIGRQAAAVMNKAKEGNKTLSDGTTISSKRLEVINDLYDSKASIKIEDLYDKNNSPIGTRIIVQLPQLVI